jgi:hypothetical protein
MQDRELESRFQQELLALEQAGAGMPFVFRPSEAWFLLGILQLVVTHPAIDSAAPGAGHFARTLGENIESRLCKFGPAMKEIARRGWERPAAPEPPMLKEPDEDTPAKKPRTAAPAPTAPKLKRGK